jgi:hypothetical protein
MTCSSIGSLSVFSGRQVILRFSGYSPTQGILLGLGNRKPIISFSGRKVPVCPISLKSLTIIIPNQQIFYTIFFSFSVYLSFLKKHRKGGFFHPSIPFLLSPDDLIKPFNDQVDFFRRYPGKGGKLEGLRKPVGLQCSSFWIIWDATKCTPPRNSF